MEEPLLARGQRLQLQEQHDDDDDGDTHHSEQPQRQPQPQHPIMTTTTDSSSSSMEPRVSVAAVTGANHGDRDKTRLFQGIFGLLGVGSLVPWNAFINAKSYFDSRFCVATGDAVDPRLESEFSLTYNLSAIICLGALIAVQYARDTRRQQQQQRNDRHHRHHHITLSQRVETTAERAQHTQHSSVWLVMVPLALYVVVFLAQSVAVLWVHGPSPTALRRFTLISMALCGMCGATATSGILATAGLFTASVSTGPFLAGQSVGGVAVSVANLVAAAWEDPHAYWQVYCDGDDHDDDDNDDGDRHNHTTTTTATTTTTSLMSHVANDNNNQTTADDTCVPYNRVDGAVLGYFLAGAAVLAAALLGYIYIDRHQRSTHRNEYETVREEAATTAVVAAAQRSASDDDSVHDSQTVDQSPCVGLELTEDFAAERLHQRRSAAATSPVQPLHRALSMDGGGGGGGYQTTTTTSNAAAIDDVPEPFVDEPPLTTAALPHPHAHADDVDDDDDATSSSHNSHNETVQVLHRVRAPALTIYLVFLVTLALFPGWISELRSVRQCQPDGHRWDNDLYTPTAFVLFNVCDLVGRILAGYVPIHRIRARTLVRGAVLRGVLFFPLLSLCVGGSRPRAEIPSDLYSNAVQILFATSNGFLVTLAFIYAPSVLPSTTHVQERSAELLNFSLSFGLLSGSFLSFVVSQVLR